MSGTGFINLTVQMPGLNALTVGLSRLQAKIADWSPFWETFGDRFFDDAQQSFASQGRHSGEPWASLSPSYAAWKSRHFPGRGILVRSGALQQSLSGKHAQGAIFRPRPTALEIGTSVPHGVYHQFGTKRMPKRPPLRVTPAFMQVVAKDLHYFLVKQWEAVRGEFKADITSVLNARL